MFSSYEEWSQSDLAQATLRNVYEAMRLSSAHHDTEGESWRRKPWSHHVRKAWFHLLPQFESQDDLAVDSKPKEGSAPPTMLPHLILALTRLSFVVALWQKEGLIPTATVGPVVDAREQEQSGE